MKRSTALGIGLGLGLLLAGFAAVCAMGYVLVTGPRMRTQPNVRAYQAEVPPLPEGVVPVDPPDTSPPGRIPEAGETAQLVNPLASTEDNRARGEVYYK
ncbi:MAG: hypothetical protein QG656_1490 [Candidatus Hydrogenedentes bacterium]|nr:hypothetical protein [Candidatus Hydrogenedentota bacterium]